MLVLSIGIFLEKVTEKVWGMAGLAL